MKKDIKKDINELKTSEASEVLVTMKGEPIITISTLEVAKEKIFKINPQMRQTLADMDFKQFERNILEGLINQKIIAEYIASQGIDQTAAYQAELRGAYEGMKNMLNARYFDEMQKKGIVTDIDDLRKKYAVEVNESYLKI